jgi:hypothetical protein
LKISYPKSHLFPSNSCEGRVTNYYKGYANQYFGALVNTNDQENEFSQVRIKIEEIMWTIDC